MFFFATSLLVLADVQQAPQKPRLPAAEQLAAIVQRTLDEARAADPDAQLRVWVAQRGTLVASCASGADKADPARLLPLGALSHSFTAVLALRLCDQGKLLLERPLKEVLPDIQPPLDAATLADALGGLLAMPRTDELVLQSAACKSYVEWIGLFRAAAPPRSVHDADDASWALAARACELAGGNSHMDLVREELLAPLELVDVLPTPLKLAQGAVELPGERGETSSVELSASPQALASWMQALLARRLLTDQATRRYMAHLQLLDGNSSNCGYGIAQTKVAGLKRYRMESRRGARQLDLSFWSLSEVALVVEARDLDSPLEQLSRRISLRIQQVEQPALAPVAYDRSAARRLAGDWEAAGRSFALRDDAEALVLVEEGRETRLVALADGAYGCASDTEARWSGLGTGPDGRAQALAILRGGHETRARRAR